MDGGGGGGLDNESSTEDAKIIFGILRVDQPPVRLMLSQGSSEPDSPQPSSTGKLSVSFEQEQKYFPESLNRSQRTPSVSSKSSVFKMETSPPRPSSTGMRLSVAGPVGTDDDDDYSTSVNAILTRRASMTTKKPKGGGGGGKRRTSSPFDSDRRRSSVFTTSSAESTAITIMDGQDGELTQEQIFENIRLHKEVLESVKQQPWEMRRKIKMIRQAKEYIRRHEGHLQERLAHSKSTKDFMASFNIILMRWWKWLKREFGNFAVNLIPWELRIKEIESHFGSVVASYFTFLRWVFWINIIMTAIIICLIIVPEVLGADPIPGDMRKEIQDYEKPTAYHLSTLWDFEGVFKYSPMFYGYYTNQAKTKEGYPLPLSYFLTGLGIYVYSFVAILRRMAKNSRQSKLSEKEDECIFSWKVFTGWDYMIGNPETAFNRFASITMGFKEAILEEKEKKKDERNWKVVSLRILANLLVLILLAFSAWAVYEVVKRSKPETMPKDANWWRQNEITLVVSLITTIFPNIFELIGMLEKYHPRKQLRWQLGRIMVLNFLNLCTLMIALFGKVEDMTDQLQKLRTPNTTVITSTMPPHMNYCVDVSVNCTLLEDFRYNQTLKETTERLKFLTNASLTTKYNPNGTFDIVTHYPGTNETISTRFNQKEWWDILHSVIPNLDRSSSLLDLRKFESEVEDKENLTLFTPRPGFSLNHTLSLIPRNSTTLKAALPLLMKLVLALVPQRSFIPPSSTPHTFTEAETSSSTGGGSEDTTVTEEISVSTVVTEDESITTTTEGANAFTTTTTTTARTTTPTPPWRIKPSRRWNWDRRRNIPNKGTVWRNARQILQKITTVEINNDFTGTTEANDATEIDDKRFNNLMLTGQNSYQSVLNGKLSTRGDIPGDVSEADHTTSTTPLPTSTVADDSEKLLTNIITVIEFIASHNSSRLDFPNLSTIDEYAKFVTNYHSYAETRMTRDPFNTSFSSHFTRKAEEIELTKCFIKACENGTMEPDNLLQYLNCSDLSCAMEILVGPRNETTPAQCIIPGSRSCFTTEAPPTMSPENNVKLGKLCWETMFGQELVKLTVMDLIITVVYILGMDFVRAIFVRILNPCWCWDLEKKFPQYGDFKIAENILHLVNNQGMIWMGLFFSPGLPAINLVKLIILMYIRSWTVMTCNVPHETVFRASRSNNFYFALLLLMLFLCVLPVGYAIVWLKPSWHCGPFADEKRMYHIFTKALMNFLPEYTHEAINYIASPGIIIPLLLLLVLVIYYLLSLTSSLREANNDLKIQLRRERTEERRKMFKIAGGTNEKESAISRWQAIIPIKTKSGPRVSILTSGKQTGFAGLAKRATLKAREMSQLSQSQEKKLVDEEGSGTDVDQISLPEDNITPIPKKDISSVHKKAARKPSTTESILSRSEIPVIKISKEEEDVSATGPLTKPDTVSTGSTPISKLTKVEDSKILPSGALQQIPAISSASKQASTPVIITKQAITSIVKPKSIQPEKQIMKKTETTKIEGGPTIVGSEVSKPSTSSSINVATKPQLPQPSTSKCLEKSSEPTRKERIMKALLSRAKKDRPKKQTNLAELNIQEGDEKSRCGSPVGALLNQDHILEMEAASMDIHPFFVRFQTGFESQDSKDGDL